MGVAGAGGGVGRRRWSLKSFGFISKTTRLHIRIQMVHTGCFGAGGGFTSAKCMFQRDGGMFRGDTETDRYALNLHRDFRNR